MSKFTFSLSLALALGFSGVSFAGHKSAGCDTCGLASPQGVVASPQGSVLATGGCDTCAPAKKKCNLFAGMHKPKTYTYEYVLKKKRVHGHKSESCDTCGGGGSTVTPSAQYASPQGTYAAPQAYGAPQASAYGAPQASAYGASQTASMVPTGEMKPAEAPAGDAAPPAPAVPPAPAPPAPAGAQSSLLLLSPTGN